MTETVTFLLILLMGSCRQENLQLFYVNSEPQPNAKYSCAASVTIARKNSLSAFFLVHV